MRSRRLPSFGLLPFVALWASGCGSYEPDLRAEIERASQLVFIQAYGPAGSSFFIQPFEVTKREFLEFVRATNYPADGRPGFLKDMRLRDGTFDPGTSGDHPVAHVTARDAEAYLEWIGMELPTLRQWRAALRGHPLAKGARILDPAFLANGYQAGIGGTSPVGFFHYDRTSEGCFDLIGNVAEWTRTRAYFSSEPEEEEHTLLSLDLESVFAYLEMAAQLTGSSRAVELATEPRELERAVVGVVVEGRSFRESWVDADFTTDTMVTLATGWRSLNPSQSLDVVGFRGVVDAATLVRRIANRAVDVPAAREDVIAWLVRQPDAITPLLERLAREDEPGASLVEASLDERRSR